MIARPRPGPRPGSLLSLLLLLLSLPAAAHLSLIRPGVESQGVLETLARFGGAVATGDFDGDGRDDLASAAYEAPNGNGIPGTGMVVINYGDVYGVTHEGAAVILFDTGDANQLFGHALASGDFDADGHDDLAIGAPRDDTAVSVDAGTIHVYEGTDGGLMNLPAQTFTQEDVNEVSEFDDRFGWALAVGRFNDDVYDDLAVGAVGEDGEVGAVYFFMGTINGLTPLVNVKLQPESIGEVNELGAQFGYSLVAADLILDENDDLVVGAPFRDRDPSSFNTGRVYVFPSNDESPTIDGAFAFDVEDLGQTANVSGHFGKDLAAGLLAGAGGGNRVAIGEPGAPGSGTVGRVHVTPLEPFPPPVAEIEHFTAGDLAGGASQIGSEFGYALAAGDADADGDDELAVGEPNATAGVGVPASGRIYLAHWQGTSLADSSLSLQGWQLNDVVAEGWRIGESLAYGLFDDFELAGLAIGAPGADYRVWRCMEDAGETAVVQAGQVHIYAPWRQPIGLRTRSAVGRDCDGEPVFSQRPFDPLSIASTTKTMTALLAAEAVMDGEVDLTDDIAFEAWPDTCFKGSDGPHTEGDVLTLDHLLRDMMDASDGDAAFMVAAMISPDAENDFPPDCSGHADIFDCDDVNTGVVQPWFVDRMNDRASELGLHDTVFANPHGSKSGSRIDGLRHRSTAWDMTLLMRTAMQNPVFRDYAGPPGSNKVARLNNLMDRPLAVAAKTGTNTFARGCLVGAGRDSLVDPRYAVAGVWGADMRVTDYDSAMVWRWTALAALMDKTVPQCGGLTEVYLQLPPRLPAAPLVRLPAASADAGAVTFASADVVAAGSSLLLDAQVWTQLDDAVDFTACLERRQIRYLQPGEAGDFGIAPFGGHQGVVVTNVASDPVDLLINASHPEIVREFVTLQPEESWLLPAAPADGAAAFEFTVESQSSASVSALRIEELGYCFELSLGSPGGPTVFQAAVVHDAAEIDYEAITAHVIGQDATVGNAVTLVVRGSDAPVAVPDHAAQPTPTARILGDYQAWPNPFNPSLTLAFDLSRPARVDLEIFDLAGRRVAVIVANEALGAGPHQRTWRARDRHGAGVASGIYLARLRAGGETATRRLVLLR